MEVIVVQAHLMCLGGTNPNRWGLVRSARSAVGAAGDPPETARWRGWYRRRRTGRGIWWHDRASGRDSERCWGDERDQGNDGSDGGRVGAVMVDVGERDDDLPAGVGGGLRPS